MFGRKSKKEERKEALAAADGAVVAMFEKRLEDALKMPGAADRYLALAAVIDDAIETMAKRHAQTQGMTEKGEARGRVAGGAGGIGALLAMAAVTDVSGLSAAAFGCYYIGKTIGEAVGREDARSREARLNDAAGSFEAQIHGRVLYRAHQAQRVAVEQCMDEMLVSPRRAELKKYPAVSDAFARAAESRRRLLPPARKPGKPRPSGASH